MSTVRASVEVDVVDVLDAVEDEDLLEELRHRELGDARARDLIERLYEERASLPASQTLSDLFWSVLGKIA